MKMEMSVEGDYGVAEDDVEQTSALEEARRDELYSSSEDDREGRFRGPDSSWRFYTQEERALATALDRAENNDLSIHLYNAHKWKEQHRRTDLSKSDKSWRSKQTWIQRDEQGKLPFLPEDSWTAWPLKPVDVPRSNEDWGVPIQESAIEADAFVNRKPWRPSLDLEESIRAEILRQAKDRFRQHEWDGPSVSSRSSSDSDPASSQSPLQQNDVAGGGIESPQSAAARHLDSKPSFMIDEDAAEAITRSCSRSIVTELEKVLTGLKHSRDGHHSGRSRSQSQSDRQASKRPEQGLSTDTIRKRKRNDATASREGEDGEREPSFDPEEHVEEEVRRARPSKRSSHRRALGIRDWTEVLGVAALVGLDAAVVDRAAMRCAALFSEGMEMRMMPPIISSAHHELRCYGPRMRLSDDDAPHHGPDAPASDKIPEDGVKQEQSRFRCPHKACPRHKNAYEQRWRLREHLKRKHRHTDDHVDSLTDGMSLEVPQGPTAALYATSDRGEDAGNQKEAPRDFKVKQEPV